MNASQEHTVDVWLNWEWLWQSIFYGSLLLSMGFLLADDSLAVQIWIPILLTLIMGLWHGLGLRWAYRSVANWEDNPNTRFVVMMIDIMLWFVLVSISVAYYFVLFGLFVHVFRHLPRRYAVVAAVSLTTSMIFEQLSDSGEVFSWGNPSLWVFLFMGLAAILIGIWISTIIEQNVVRRQLIEQLRATQAELSASEHQKGVLEERQRLTREIHDTLAQGFTSIIMHLEAADQALPSDHDTMQKHLNRARSTARASLEESRRFIRDLRPDLLEQHSLVDAIKRVAQQWQGKTGITLQETWTGQPIPLHSTIEVTLLRAIQEALNNIWKHAQATHVMITLSYMDTLVMVDIQDNGVGLEASNSLFDGGFGLQAMRERVAQCGGSVSLESEPGEGTTVVITIPLS
jgi:signal transduction histidine kinase